MPLQVALPNAVATVAQFRTRVEGVRKRLEKSPSVIVLRVM